MPTQCRDYEGETLTCFTLRCFVNTIVLGYADYAMLLLLAGNSLHHQAACEVPVCRLVGDIAFQS